MKKLKPNMQMCLSYQEKLIREQAEQIIAAKEIGISQQSIDKMISLMAISKASYDDMKRRYEEHGK